MNLGMEAWLQHWSLNRKAEMLRLASDWVFRLKMLILRMLKATLGVGLTFRDLQ